MQSITESDFEAGVRELAPEEIEAVAGGEVPGFPIPWDPTPAPCPK